MITPLAERRIPKRKDRFNTTIVLSLLYLLVFTFPFWIGLIPGMEPIIIDRIALYIVVVFLLLGIGSNLFIWWRWRTKWEEIAAPLGLTVESYRPSTMSIFPWYRISGVYRGYPITIERFTRGSGRRRKIFTSISLALDESSGERLLLKSQSFFHKFSSVFQQQDPNLQEITLGYEEIDKHIRILSTSEYYAKSSLASHSIQQGLIELVPQAPDMQIDILSKGVHYQERTPITDDEYMLAVITLLADLTDYARRYR